MGWKNVKEHYGIGYYVCVTTKGLCIGSCYVHDLICIAETDTKRDWRDEVNLDRTDIGCNLTIWRLHSLGRGDPFDGWVKAMTDDPQALRRLIDTPDQFARSLPVYTYDCDGNILEKQCEEYGWPNVTHDGDMMYKNTYSADRNEVIEWAKRNMEAGRENSVDHVAQAERELLRAKDRLERFECALRKLEAA